MAAGTKGLATVLAIGTANPPNYILQDDFPDFYFNVTNSDHLVQLKQKFKRMCNNSMINKRHYLIDEEILKQHPNISTLGANSLDTRREIVIDAVPKLGREAALKALKEWGQPLSKLTHLIFCTSSYVNSIPGPDFVLAKMIGLPSHVNRLNIYDHGCHAGGSVLRVAKALAESTPGSRVLAVCAETMATSFQAPNPDHLDIVVGHCLFGDGAAAMVIGSDPIPSEETPLFEIVLAQQTTVGGSEAAIHGKTTERGQIYYLSKDIPFCVSSSVKKCMVDAFSSLGMEINGSDWNSLFYVVHPGGKAVLNGLEEELKLKEEKLVASRTILREYGNMWSPCVFFVLDEMRKKSSSEGKSTTGDGCDWGALLTFGPGLTVETIVLHSIPLKHH